MSDIRNIYLYSQCVMRQRWLEGESVIIGNSYMAYHYNLNFINGRWPAEEAIIMKALIEKQTWATYWAYRYAKNIICCRWPEAEPYIMKDPKFAYHYNWDILGRKRWSEAEPYIMTDPECAYQYAFRIIKGRWPEAEPYIMKHKYWHTQYNNNIHNLE